MKNAIMVLMLVFGFVGSSYAGECANGICSAAARPVRTVVNITREIVAVPVRAVAAVVSPRTCCTNVQTDCCGGTFTKDVVKYQPLRRRLINRTTVVSNGCNCR